VLLIRRRMLCSSRWVIPGLAEGVTGWLASRRQPVFGRPSASGEKWPALTAAGGRAGQCDRAGSGVRARRRTGAAAANTRATQVRVQEASNTRATRTNGIPRHTISYEAARTLDRYLRVRARHAQAWRPQLWLGVNNRGPLTAAGIYQIVARRGRQCGVEVYPHRFRHHFSHTWLYRGGAEGDLMELNGWSSPQMLTRYGASARAARARRTYDRIMEDSP